MTSLIDILGMNIKLIRTMRDMSQEDVAKACGLTQNVVSDIEQGKSNPTLMTVHKISRGMGVGVTTLLNDYLLRELYSDAMKKEETV